MHPLSRFRSLVPRLALVGLLSCLLVACGLGRAQHPDTRIHRDTNLVHERCDVDGSNAVAHDVNGDGRADVVTVMAGSRELCRSVDLNFDGVVDVWVYRTADGSVRRRETDYDRDGHIDEVTTYVSGVVTHQQQATHLVGKIDTWHYFESGRLARSERDSDGDGVIDQWWEYPRMPTSDCARVHADVDGDGRPDPGATVDLCEKQDPGAVPPPQETPAANARPLQAGGNL